MAKTETTRTIQEIDPDIKAATLPVLRDVGELYRTGQLGAVADSQAVRDALMETGKLGYQTMKGGLGTENILNKLRGTEGAMLAAGQGALGSARAGRAREAGLQDRAMELQAADLQAKRAGAEAYGRSAEGQRMLDQETLDAKAKAAERYFGYLGAAPQSQTQTTTAPKQKSGGK